MLTDRWTPLRYHPHQYQLWRSKARFKNVYAGRGSGKSELAKRFIVRQLPLQKPWPDPIYFYCLPTRPWAKRVAWQDLVNLIPPHWLARPPSLSERIIYTKYGSKLYVMGLDAPERSIEGVQWDGGIFDESCNIKPKVFDLSLMPALSHRNGWAWRIGAPKRYGVGALEFRASCEKGASGEDPEWETYTWPSSDILSAKDLAYARATLSEKDFNEQYNARWEDAGGGVFHAWSNKNITPTNFDRSQRILVGMDFNVDPMCWVVGHLRGNQIHIFDELQVGNTNTPNTLNLLYKKYGRYAIGWDWYGDATGARRQTSATRSDYAHIHGDKRFKRSKFHIPKKNPPVADRIAACNALMQSSNGFVRLFVDPSCTNLIQDIEALSYKEGERKIDSVGGTVGHFADALGYPIYREFPVTVIYDEVHKAGLWAA